jgi:hypothetical protein
MIFFHAEKHSKTDNMYLTSELILQAEAKQICLILEDHVSAERIPLVHSLEGTNVFSLETLLSMVIWILDVSDNTKIQDLKQLGKLCFILYTYICFKLSFTSFCSEVRDVVTNMTQCKKKPTINIIRSTVIDCVKSVLGKMPGHLSVRDIRKDVHKILMTKFDNTDPEKFSIKHGLITRELRMFERIEHVIKNNDLDVHVVIGANHVSKLLSNEDVKNLGVNVRAFRRLEGIANHHYPGERLLDKLKAYKISSV